MHRKAIVSLSLCCLFSCTLLGQRIEDYMITADTASDPLDRLVAMDSVTSMSYRKDNDTFVSYCIDYIELARELDSIEAAARKVISLGYTLTVVKNDPARTLKIVDGVLMHKYKIDDPSILGRVYLKRGGANYRLDLSEAVLDYQKAIESFKSIPVFTHRDSLYLADAYLFNGQAYSNLNQFVPAGENYKNAYQLFETLGDYEYMFYAQQGITIMYSMNGFLEKAISEREKNISKIEELKLDHHLLTEYYNQALDYKKLGDRAQQKEFLLKAAERLRKPKTGKQDGSDPMYIYSALIEFYCEDRDFDTAADYVEMMEENWKNSGQDLLGESHYNRGQSTYYFAVKDYDNALTYGLKRLENAIALDYGDDIIDAHSSLADIYEARGEYKKSLENKNAYSRLKDSIYNKSTANSLAYYQTLYETEKQEKELVAKNSSIQLLEKDNEAFRKLIVFSSVSLFLLFGMILLYRNQLHLKNKKRLQERFSQDLLVSQEEERMRISKDLHDGLGQRLLVIKNRLISSDDSETRSMVDTTIEEVRAISRDLHPFQLQEMGITKAIEHTLRQIDENTTLFSAAEIDNIDDLFSAEQEVNIYRIVQESLSNIIKHASAEAGKVSIKKLANAITISIRDNGTGFDFSEKVRNVKSLGLKTLLERTKFLNGQMRVESSRNTGTSIEFQFPV